MILMANPSIVIENCASFLHVNYGMSQQKHWYCPCGVVFTFVLVYKGHTTVEDVKHRRTYDLHITLHINSKPVPCAEEHVINKVQVPKVTTIPCK